ncbi:MAG: DUF1311 domain-containing protein [Gemmatimonadaceae bacterium]|nr:DUF1311 domain-containing protein [Gloeobacterales cyanobacterium ES-bin-141]
MGSIVTCELRPALAQVQDNKQECDAATTQAQINFCAGQAADKVDRELNQAYQQISLNIANEQKYLLTESQQAWIKFRDAHCAFERSYYTGGTLSTTVYLTCLEKLTRQRLQQVEQTLAQQKSR